MNCIVVLDDPAGHLRYELFDYYGGKLCIVIGINRNENLLWVALVPGEPYRIDQDTTIETEASFQQLYQRLAKLTVFL